MTWTAREDAILRAAGSYAAAQRALPYRSRESIRARATRLRLPWRPGRHAPRGRPPRTADEWLCAVFLTHLPRSADVGAVLDALAASRDWRALARAWLADRELRGGGVLSGRVPVASGPLGAAWADDAF
jgi:hypothetical protein